jgi:lipopolysaccharide biosynthesis regulator YciM
MLTAGYFVALSSRDALARWQQSRQDRLTARIDRLHADGVRALLAGDAAQAGDLFKQVTEQAPARAEAWLLAGDAARAVADIDRATELHLRAQGLMPDDPRVLEALSADAQAEGDLERARRYQDQLLERHGATAPRRERQRDLAIAASDWAAALVAEEECARGRKRSVAEEQLRCGLRIEAAVLDMEAGDTEPALMAARRLANEVPTFEPVYGVLADLYRHADDHEAVAAVLSEGYGATGSLALLQRLVAQHLEQEQPEAAIADLVAASAELGSDEAVAARIMLGRLYHRVGLVEEADEEFAAVADRVEDSPVVDYYRARAAYRGGDAAKAYETLRESIRTAGYLDVRYVCRECGTRHDTLARRCSRCGKWSTFDMDISRDARAAAPVEAPVI